MDELMRVLAIIYNLTNEKAKAAVENSIKAHKTAVKLSDSCYVVYTESLPIKIFDELRKHIDGNDHLYVIPLKKPYTGYGPRKNLDWLKDRLDYY
jgi:hypothetical protein